MFQSTLTAVLDAGYGARFVARGDSMHPAIRDGEAVQVERCQPGSLRVGDVVLARAPRGLTAHRIIEIRPGTAQVVTRGDNCLRSDQPLDFGEICARVIAVERKGARIRLFDEPLTLFTLPRRILLYWRSIRPRFQR
jgi:hypothetical protein